MFTSRLIFQVICEAVSATSLQSCLTLCDPIDGSPPSSPVPGILKARTLEWVAISFSNAWKWKVKVKSLSRVRPSATPWTAAYQAPPSMGFSRQKYWSGVPLPSPKLFLEDEKQETSVARREMRVINMARFFQIQDVLYCPGSQAVALAQKTKIPPLERLWN